MGIDNEVNRYADERVNHYMGVAARVSFAVVSSCCVALAGWFVFEGLALGHADGVRNAALVASAPVAGMIVFTILQFRWRAFA